MPEIAEEGIDSGGIHEKTKDLSAHGEDIVMVARVAEGGGHNVHEPPITFPGFIDGITGSEVGRAGLILVILSVVGLITSFTAAWITIEGQEARSDSYSFSDFGDDFKDDEGRWLDDYFYGNARNAVIGFIVLLIVGLMLVWQEMTGKVYSMILPHIPSRLRSNPDHPEFLKVLLAFITVIVSLVIIISGSRFIGFTRALGESEALGFGLDVGTTAGWIVFLLGLVLLALEVHYLHTKLKPLILGDSVPYRRGVRKCITFMALTSMIGLIFFSLLPFMTIEEEVDVIDPISEEESKMVFNDGFISIFAEIGFQEFEDLDRDLSVMRGCLWGTFFLSSLILIGLLYLEFAGNEITDGFHQGISLGALVPLLAIILLIFQLMFFNHVGAIEDGDSEFSQTSTSFGSNYIPLLCGIVLLGLGILYVKETYPISISRVLGTQSPSMDSESSDEGTVIIQDDDHEDADRVVNADGDNDVADGVGKEG